ncbi:MAG: ATP-binding cassette domain-containing protein [Clostridiales Family XIII bacterium]|jgi:energy-coupling factor transport system ATP-binding protein|nr:ATP-binding cassette domain-containing protein [Clostridiales Family XIII bacterium]
MDVFTLNEFTFTYPGGKRAVLDDVSLSVGRGEFVTLCGRSGSGKTTLLRNLKPPLAPYGSADGEILFYGRPLSSVGFREQAQRIGYVLQDPDNQIATDKVWHELAFGLENLGYSSDMIRLRVAEMASFFGIQTWFRKDVSSLSGGQKQLLNLASVMAVQPNVLILDEPTAQLDPVAAADFLETLKKINREIGVTIIISEHRLEEVFPMSDRAIVLDKGRVIADAHPKRVGVSLAQYGHDMFVSMPTTMQVFMAVETDVEIRSRRAESPAMANPAFPITIREGREWLSGVFQNRKLKKTYIERDSDRGGAPLADRTARGDTPGGHNTRVRGQSGDVSNDRRAHYDNGNTAPGGAPYDSEYYAAAPHKRLFESSKRRSRTKFLINTKSSVPESKAVILRGVWFKYERGDEDVVRDLSLEIPAGKLMCIVGGNGAGKSTVLKLISGLLIPHRGKIIINGINSDKLRASERFGGIFGVLPQNPQTLFSEITVRQDLAEVFRDKKSVASGRLPAEARQIRIDGVTTLLEIDNLLDHHPYDLSGGEQQRVALAKILLTDPEILLLDEPTKGMDNHFKEKFSIMLRALLDKGKTVVIVSHDVEFCAKHADVCALLFDGEIVTVNEPGRFFSGNSYYTTAANRMSRHIFENAVTAKEVIALCKENLTE